MRVLLIYNPRAGNGVDDDARRLVDLIRAEGHDASWRSSKDRRLRSAFTEPFDVIAVAGGDGTVAKVARLLRG
ncbi:MAG TPA: diacylglycerol kinase family protein, partial [Casimicrobiaceae bacterium]|nr:diacylglycerol kinase family protein [Casimicrobiaceae bacterium]